MSEQSWTVRREQPEEQDSDTYIAYGISIVLSFALGAFIGVMGPYFMAARSRRVGSAGRQRAMMEHDSGSGVKLRGAVGGTVLCLMNVCFYIVPYESKRRKRQER